MPALRRVSSTVRGVLCGQNHVLRDDWTVVSNDKSLCAQFEHTILITEEGAEVLTAYEPFAEIK